MRYWAVVFKKLPATAMALYPVILFKNQKVKHDPRIIRHEMIHFKQQLELLIIPFYILYLLCYLINVVKFRDHHKAYMNICFEIEAYDNEDNPYYLIQRKPYSWLSQVR